MLPSRKNRSTTLRARNQRAVTNRAITSTLEKLESRRLLSAGSLDATFNADNTPGYILDTLGPNYGAGIGGVAIDPTTGDIIVAGSADGHTAIARYDSSGQPVASFVGDGVVTTPVDGHPGVIAAALTGDDFATNVVIRADGKIIVSGTVQEDDGNFDIFAMALNSDGSTDSDFDPAHSGVTIVQADGDQFASDSILSGNTVYVLGSGEDQADIAKFDSSGLDTSFGTDGLMTVGDLGSGMSIRAGTLQAGGKLVVAGANDNAGFIARIDLDSGSVDTTFGSDPSGLVQTPVHASDDYNDITQDADGNLLALGTYIINVQAPFAEQATQVQRFTADGILDTTFGGVGDAPAGEAEVLPADPGDGYVAMTYLPSQMVIDPQGRIDITGTSRDATGDNEVDSLMAVRFTAAGAPDAAFGTNGVALNAITGNFDIGDGIALQSDGKIVVGGTAEETDFLTARYTTDQGQAAPVADAGPDQTVNEGDVVTFDGSNSTGTDLTYSWDLNGDGTFGDATGPVVTWTYGDNGPVTVSLQVTDSLDQTSVDTALVTVNNVAPIVDPVSGPTSPLVRQQTASFSGSFTDPGALDTQEVSWDFGDGNMIAYHSSTDPGALTPSHVYTTSGNYTVTLSVMDDDGGVGTNTTSVNIVAAAVQGGNLIVGGTDAGETIAVTNATGGQKKVVINGVQVGLFTMTGHVIVYAGAGDDTVNIGNNVGGAEVYGGAGNDTINGGNGNDTLSGDDGDDVIDGNAGNDSILGGEGNDTLTGGADNDTARGGDGDDVITNNGGDDLLDGGAGNDTLNAGGGADTAIGGDGNDSIVGGAGNDSLYGNDGNDTITGNGGDDFIDGGAGDDSLVGGAGNDIVLGGDGNDTLQGGADRDILIGGSGADSIYGNADEDVLIASGTDIDSDMSQLLAAQSVWVSADTYADRVSSLMTNYFIPDVTVHDDMAVDTVAGGAGTDYFIVNTDPAAKDIIDQKAGETATDVD